MLKTYNNNYAYSNIQHPDTPYLQVFPLFQRKLGNTMISKKQDNAKKHCVDDGMDNFTSLDGQCNHCSGDQHVKKGKYVKKRNIVHFGIL